jgi:hypothetical protein
MQTFELKLQTNKVVTWTGQDAEDAARRYVDCHREATVVATRTDRTPQIRVLGRRAMIDGSMIL